MPHEIDPAEFAALKTEVAELRAELRSVLRITRDKAGAITQTSLRADTLRSQVITIVDKTARVRGMFASEENGPALALWGDDGQARIHFRVAENRAHLNLFSQDNEQAFQTWIDKAGQPNLVLYSTGAIPRIGLRTLKDAGIIALTSTGNRPRIVLHSDATEGKLLFLDTRGNVIASTIVNAETAGYSLAYPGGKPAAALNATSEATVLSIHNPAGPLGVLLSATDKGRMFTMGSDIDHGPGEATIALIDLPETSAALRLRGSDGKLACEILTGAKGNNLTIASPGGGTAIHLSATPDGSAVNTYAPKTGIHASLLSTDEAAICELNTGEKPDTRLRLIQTAAIGTLDMTLGGKHRGGIAVKPEEGYLILTGAEGETAAHLNLHIQREGGGLLVAGQNETTHLRLGSTESGGRLVIHNELGIPRIDAGIADDGGNVRLSWGGTLSVAAQAGAEGGLIIVNDPAGKIRSTLPPGQEPDSDFHSED